MVLVAIWFQYAMTSLPGETAIVRPLDWVATAALEAATSGAIVSLPPPPHAAKRRIGSGESNASAAARNSWRGLVGEYNDCGK
jgi:hypothetical protein